MDKPLKTTKNCTVISLDILSNIEIDKAKKEFDVNTKSEVDTIRAKYAQRDKNDKSIIPKFLGYIARTKGYYDNRRKSYEYYETSMDYIQQYLSKLKFKHPTQYLPFSDLFKTTAGKASANYSQRSVVLSEITKAKNAIHLISSSVSYSKEEKYQRMYEIISERDRRINSLKLNLNTIRLLVRTIDNKKYSQYRKGLFDTLFANRNDDFYKALIEIKEPISEISSDPMGDIDIYGYKYKIK